MRPCCVCGEEVAYGPGRRKCRTCRRWCHAGCAIDTSHGDGLSPVCKTCFRSDPGDFLRREAVVMIGGEKFKEDSGVTPLQFVLWCLVYGRAAGPEATEKLGISAEDVSVYDRRLEENDVWSEDGHLCLDEQAWETPSTFSIGCIITSLVAQGVLVRGRSEQGATVEATDAAREGRSPP